MSSVFLPTHTMPGWLQVFADHQPVSVVANALRGLILGPSALPPGQSVAVQTLHALGWTVAILAVVPPVAIRTYRYTVS